MDGQGFFPIERGGMLAIYTLASEVRMVDIELQEQRLVLVVPAGAAV